MYHALQHSLAKLYQCFPKLPTVIWLAILLPISPGYAQENADTRQDVLEAIAQLKLLPQWKQLKESDAYLDQQFLNTGPELNARLTVQSPEGKPATGALILVFESMNDLFNNVYPIWENLHRVESLRSPIAITTTNALGVAELSHVRRRGPGHPSRDNALNIARAFAVILHSEFGLTPAYFSQTDELQEQTITLSQNRSYKGKIKNSTKNLLSKTPLTITTWSPSKGDFRDPKQCVLRDSPFAPRTVIDENGEFELAGLPTSGWISLALEHRELEIKSNSDALVELKQQPLQLEAILKQTDKKEIRFRCVDEFTGQPIPGCKLSEFGRWQTTNDEGVLETTNYTFAFSSPEKNPPSRSVVVSVLPPEGFVAGRFSSEPPQDGQPLELRLSRGVRVSGKVVDERTEKGIGGIEIRFSVTPPDNQELGFFPIVAAITDADGRYEAYVPKAKVTATISSLAIGFQLRIQQGDEANKSPLQVDSEFQQTLNLSELTETQVNFRLNRSKPVRGIVLGRDGKPAKDIRVALQQPILDGGFSSFTKTDAKGAFQIPTIPTAGLKLRVAAFDDNSSTTTSVTINKFGSYEGGPVVLKLSEASEPKTIVGKVVVDGKGEPNASVIAYSDDPEARRNVSGGFTSRPQAIGSGRTNERGEFEITLKDTEATHYYVRVVAPEHLMNWSNRILEIENGKNQYPPIEFRTRYGDLKISGEVLTPDGDVVQGASVRAFPRERVQLTRVQKDGPNPNSDTSSISDAEGKFECKNLGEGKVELQIHPNPSHDTWTNAAFQSIVTTAGKAELILIVDPKLSVPPSKIDPISTIELDSLIPKDRFKPNGREFQIQGRVTDSDGQPIPEVSAFVIAAKPLAGLQISNPLMHPVCGTEAQTDAHGNYTISIPDDDLQVCIGILRTDYAPILTKYLAKDSKLQQHSLEKAKPKTPESRGPRSSIATGIPNALLVVTQSSRAPNIDNFATHQVLRTDITDSLGQLTLPSTYGTDEYHIVFKPGQSPKLLNHSFFGSSGQTNRVFSMKGRIVDAKGPVANYRLCCSGSFREHFYQTTTDNEGAFQFDGLMFQNAAPNFEIYIYGDHSTRDPRGWLKTRVIPNQPNQVIADLGELKLDNGRRLKIDTKTLAGKANPTNATLSVALRQRRNDPVSFPLDSSGTTVLDNLPGEPITIRFNLGRSKLWGIEPEFQKIGFQDSGSASFGLPMDADTDLTITID